LDFLRSVRAGSITHRFLIINPRWLAHVWWMTGKAVSRPTPWRSVFVLCRKCGKKLDGGFGRKRRESLRTVLREALRGAGRRREVRICETSCFGICPKGGVTALNATRPGMIHVIPTGASGDEAMRTLLGGDAIADDDGVEAA
jgi:hypothetical protein